MEEKKLSDIAVYTIKLVDQTINPEEFEELNSIISSSSQAAKIYNQLMVLISNFEDYGEEIISDESTLEGVLDKGFWKTLSEYEKTAPEIEISQEQSQRELIQKVVYPPRQKRKMSKFSIIFLAMNAAALLFFVLFLKFAPSTPVEVATLSDSMNAKWADMDSSIQNGTRLVAASNKLMLREGIAALTFDNHTKAIIEAPAEFQILADDRIGLIYGKVYATVPKEAVGFSIYTQNAKIVDLGTEFGVKADARGDTYLHVLKGKTALIAGKKSIAVSMEVSKGTAKKISGVTGEISDIGCQVDYFVRDINSESQIVWKGQTNIDLADVIRNGNGLGTGNSQVHLSYAKGITKDYCPGYTLTLKNYLPIKDHPFIDGIFIPNGKTVVSSRGDVFEDFLWTDGVYSADLLASPDPGFFNIDGQPRTIRFDGQEYSDKGKSCIVMCNSNHGITFDLNAIRKSYHARIDQFAARVGLIDFDKKRCNANFYVLVDGQLRYSLLGYSQKGVLNDVSVKLEDTDRFLTLATSENVDQIDYMANSTLYENWCVFTEPVLVFK